MFIFVILAVAAFHCSPRAWPAITGDFDESLWSYLAAGVRHHLGAISLAIAMPLAVAVALFISHYAPRKLAHTLGYFIDLLAAIPSVVYGLWGIGVLAPILSRSWYPWLEDHLGFLPFFRGPASTSGRTILTVAVVFAVMILPIITAISREVFLQTPRLHEEAALALGAPVGDDPSGGAPARSFG
ncbi:MAG: ABC transporter permease subunit [Ilumatobacteraceae bacterium]